MNTTIAKTSLIAASLLASVLFGGYASAQTRSEQCDLVARGAALSAPATTQNGGRAASDTRGNANVSGDLRTNRNYQVAYDRCARGLN